MPYQKTDNPSQSTKPNQGGSGQPQSDADRRTSGANPGPSDPERSKGGRTPQNDDDDMDNDTEPKGSSQTEPKSGAQQASTRGIGMAENDRNATDDRSKSGQPQRQGAGSSPGRPGSEVNQK